MASVLNQVAHERTVHDTTANDGKATDAKTAEAIASMKRGLDKFFTRFARELEGDSDELAV